MLNNEFTSPDGGKVGVFIGGDAGNDTITGSEDADVIDSGTGIDTVLYADGAVIAQVNGFWTVTVGV